MKNNQNNKVKGGAVYVFLCFVLVTLICAAVVTAVGTAKKTNSADKTTQKPVVITDTTKSEETTPKDESTDTSAASPTEKPTYDFCLPVNGSIIKNYSGEIPVFSMTMNDYRAHKGIDIEASEGDEVACVGDGVISKIYDDPFMGKTVEISHGGMTSIYKNLGDELYEGISVDQKVSAGQKIGTVGHSCKTEAADEPHLHFELTCDGNAVNPTDYINFTNAVDEKLEG